MQINVKNSGWIQLKKIIDDRDGALCIMNALNEIPFEIKRVYYINNLENMHSIRGKHAHRTLRQVIFCISGCFTLSLDDGENTQEIVMMKDNEGILLGPGLWHTMHDFSSGCVLLVVASDYYDEKDYIRDYQQFLKFVKGEKQ